MSKRTANVAVYGLGFVGLTLAVVLAESGYRVVGFELRDELREKILRGEAPFMEAGLAQGISRALKSGKLKVMGDTAGIRADVHIISVGTPLDQDGECRLDMISRVSRQIALQVRDGDLICLRSTVKVGTTRQVVLPLLKESGKDFLLAYTPERTLEGDALRELTQLPQILAGLDSESEEAAAAFFGRVTSTLIRVSSLETGELIKLTDNAYRDVRFAFSNEIASIAGSWGVDGDEVLWAAGLGYPRTDVAVAGPVGGPCLSKDSFILAQSAEEVGESADLALGARVTNQRVLERVQNSILRLCPEGGTIAVLGVAFKGAPATDDTRGSSALTVVAGVIASGHSCSVRLFDPCGASPEREWWQQLPSYARDRITQVDSWQEACISANVVLIGNEHPAVLAIDVNDLLDSCGSKARIIDFWSGRRSRATATQVPVNYSPWHRVGHTEFP